MLLKQIFKTPSGAQRRALFESAHSTRFRFVTVRCVASTGEPDATPYHRDGVYVWRLEKIPRGKPAVHAPLNLAPPQPQHWRPLK